MVPATSLGFAAAARALAAEARALGLTVPAFRSPPGLSGATRTLRRRADGGAVVAVRVRGRPLADVAADLVEGVLRANGLDRPAAAAMREPLLAAARHAVEGRAA
jgi:hypothetical protein